MVAVPGREALAPVDLPFNARALEQQFQLGTPDRDPGGEGSWLLLEGEHLLLTEVGGALRLPVGESPLLTSSQPPLYIGQWQGRPCRLLPLEKGGQAPVELQRHFLRAAETRLDAALLSLGGIARMIMHWEQTSRYCGQCGLKMHRLAGEWGKECSGCGGHHFPRIHPCVIGLVIRAGEILLVRKAEWAAHRYSLVAGFVEFGESLEEAMAREVFEETGIYIDQIDYLGSQSWPFPSQLMCGFVAVYAGGDLQLNDGELADARWCRLDNLPELPPHRSIARYIIDRAGDYLARLAR